MTILRNPEMAALNDLLVAAEETIANYRDLSRLLEDAEVTTAFDEIQAERGALVEKLKAAIRLRDELPSEPDADKVDLEELAHHLRAAVSDNDTQRALEERIHAEEHALELVTACRGQPLSEKELAIVSEFSLHIESSLNRLRGLES